MGVFLIDNNRWYLSTWFIAILFSFWFLVVPLIVGMIFINRQKKEMENCFFNLNKDKQKALIAIDELKTSFLQKEQALISMNLSEKLKAYAAIKKDQETVAQIKKDYNNRIVNLDKIFFQKQKEVGIIQLTQHLKILSYTRQKATELAKLDNAIINRKQAIKDVFAKKELVHLEDESLYQSFGFFDPKFGLEDSDEYLKSLHLVRKKQKELVKEKIATDHLDGWTINGSAQKGKVQNNQNIKQIIRSFNNECDTVISKVKFNNVEVAEKKIRKSFYNFNRLNRYNQISIKGEYLDLKLEELFLVHEYALKKQEEKEEQFKQREKLREEKKAQKEWENKLKELKNKLKKEEKHYQQALSQHSDQMTEEEISRYKSNIEEIQNDIQEADYRVRNKKAGYVYVISNIGCFGEIVYKIGATRRLEPLDRVRELGNASVPFRFDVHALIFSEDAMGLEHELHNVFQHRRVNKINQRKEFFRVELSEIERIIKRNHHEAVHFDYSHTAEDYRQTLALEQQIAKQHII